MLSELLATGDTMGAVKTVQALYGFDLTRADQFVEELSTKPNVNPKH
jgi:hypothetical protein